MRYTVNSPFTLLESPRYWTILTLVLVLGESYSGNCLDMWSHLSIDSSISIVSIGTVVTMVSMMAIIAVPGVSFSFSISFGSGLSFPLSIDYMSIRTVSIVTMSIAVMSQSMAIVTIPGVSFSFSCWLSFRNS